MRSRTHTAVTAVGSVAERQQALRERRDPWQARTLHQLLDEAAERWPERPCVVTDAGSWRYRDIQQWSERLAAGLVAAGVQPGQHVALLMANYPEFVAAKFAIARAGAVAVPVNFLNRRDELGYVLRQSDAVMLLTMDRFRGLDYLQFLDELAPDWESRGGGEAFPKLRQVVVMPTGDQPVREGVTALSQLGDGLTWTPLQNHPGPWSNSDIIYTSGTTGSPKGVMLTHDMLTRTAFGSAWGRAFEDGRRILFSLPMYHVYGYVEGLLPVLYVGGAIIPQLKFDAADTLAGIEHHQASDVLLIPTMTLALLDEVKKHPDRYDLSSMHAMISSGGRSPAWIWDQIFEHLAPQELTSGYGMSEVTASSTVTRPDDPHQRLRTSNGRLRDAGPAGDPALGGLLVAYRVVDPNTGATLAPGQVGELQAKGPGVTAGYYNKPEATAEAFTEDGWLHTGDLGSIDPDGYLLLAGRLKESYRCGGEQVIPSDAEDLLVTHPAVLQAHVVPVPDERMGEVGVAFVVLREPCTTTPAELIEFCSQRLARFKVPRHVIPIAVEDLPTTPSGRARKFLLVQKALVLLGLSA
jgi:fatty-acyl-CoA synthase